LAKFSLKTTNFVQIIVMNSYLMMTMMIKMTMMMMMMIIIIIIIIILRFPPEKTDFLVNSKPRTQGSIR